jgi:hypothetical protein
MIAGYGDIHYQTDLNSENNKSILINIRQLYAQKYKKTNKKNSAPC